MTWAREVARGATTSLVAPAALLAGALVVAVGGTGADAVVSLTQLTRGPDVPVSSVQLAGGEAADAPDATELEGEMQVWVSKRGRTERSHGAAGSADDITGASRDATGRADQAGREKQDGGSSTRPAGPGASGSGQGRPPSTSAPGTSPSRPAPSVPKPGPAGDTIDQTQQQIDDLLKPVKPITDEVLGGLGR